MAKNADLGAAKTAKKDEFYTQLTDIEKEMRYYRKHFQGKTVLCNCDDPFESNFFKYFALNFNRLGLKKLIATCYYSSPIAGQQLQYGCDANGQMTFYFEDKGAEENKSKRPYKAVVTQVYDKMGDGGVDMLDVAELFRTGENELVELEGDGDFRSPECLDLLDESDIVVTNPPFSLFREYVATLAEHQKHLLRNRLRQFLLRKVSRFKKEISYKMISYNHHSMRGKLQEKKNTILKLAELLEAKRTELAKVDSRFCSDIFYLFNNLNIRHNNVDPSINGKFKQAVADMPPEELEHWYDETYQMCLLAFLRLEQADRKIEFDKLKSVIEST